MSNKHGELKKDAEKVVEIVEQCSVILSGNKPEVQGAALADLLAIWLAGHIGLEQESLKEMLEFHIEYVKKLIPENEKMLLARMQAKGTG